MRIFQKEGNTVDLIAFPEEQVDIGEYLIIEDHKLEKSLLVQVIDIRYVNVPGVFEDILRSGMIDNSIDGKDVDPLGASSQIALLKDTMLLICKVRGTGSEGFFSAWGSFLPSRNASTIKHLMIENSIPNSVRLPIHIGSVNKSPLIISAKSLDGKLNIITGRKGTGKSHMAKILLLGLIGHGAPCFVFDINGEYVNLDKTKRGESDHPYKLKVLTPKKNLKFSIESLGLNPILNMLSHALDLPWNSTRVFLTIWNDLYRRGCLKLETLGEAIQNAKCHESIREALGSRYSTMLNSGLFGDESEEIEGLDLARDLGKGGALIVNLKDQSSVHRRMIVELLLSKISEMLYYERLRGVFLFAEEAHLYLRETYWDDIISRMRHIGLFTTFITNQPDTIKENIYRQADNLFIFNFLNDKDLEMISRASKIDAESIRLIVRELPPHHCLVLGDVVDNFPIVTRTRDLEVETMGRTRFFFQE
ncbi:MAG: DUF87 domain-containing protein [Candidatus Bathyarchaeia archaeon]